MTHQLIISFSVCALTFDANAAKSCCLRWGKPRIIIWEL